MTIPDVRRRKPIIDSRIERQICLGMIISSRFLREVKPMYDTGKLQVSHIARIAEWCIEYNSKYNKAPGQYIEDLFLQHKRNIAEDEAGLIEEFLSGISEEYEKSDGFNVDYILDKAEQHFRLSALKNLQEGLSQAVIGGRVEEAEELVKGYERPSRPKSKGIDPLRNIDCIISALQPEEDNTDIVLWLPGDLGKAVGPLERGFLSAVQAESGTGKTWWLWYIAQLATFAGKDTILFSMEISELRMTKRVWQSVSGLSLVSGPVLIPIFDCMKNQTKQCPDGCGIKLIDINDKGKMSPRPEFKDAPRGYRPCTKCRGSADFIPTSWWRLSNQTEKLDPVSALKKHAVLDRTGTLKRAGKLHVIEYPSRRHTMQDLEIYLNNLEYYDGFIPAVVITDYADKLKWRVPSDPRVSIGEIWDSHKALAQQRHCLVVTASQSNTMRSGKKVGGGTWGETQEKEHLIDLGIAFNQSASDQAAGIMRASLAKKRHGQVERVAEVVILQQLAIGRPYIDSCRIIRKDH